jgi:hypothetical protein
MITAFSISVTWPMYRARRCATVGAGAKRYLTEAKEIIG